MAGASERRKEFIVGLGLVLEFVMMETFSESGSQREHDVAEHDGDRRRRWSIASPRTIEQ